MSTEITTILNWGTITNANLNPNVGPQHAENYGQGYITFTINSSILQTTRPNNTYYQSQIFAFYFDRGTNTTRFSPYNTISISAPHNSTIFVQRIGGNGNSVQLFYFRTLPSGIFPTTFNVTINFEGAAWGYGPAVFPLTPRESYDDHILYANNISMNDLEEISLRTHDFITINPIPNPMTDTYLTDFYNHMSTLSSFQTLYNTLICLFEDTEVLTPSGYISVKTLNSGDSIITSDGRESKIKKIWSSNMPLCDRFLPIIIPANSIAENYPPKDCRLSKYHLINFNGNWITPYKNEHIFKYDREVKSIKYYHLELENYFTDNLVINGGLVVESLGNGEKDNSAEWEDRVNNSIIL